MPIFKQWSIRANAHVVIWKVEEPESFFSAQTGLVSDKKNEVKRLEHLAGRYLLKFLAPEIELGQIAVSDLGKPYLPENRPYFSISHSFPYIAVSVDYENDTGIDIQVVQEKILRIQHKFLSEQEQLITENKTEKITLAWAAKEAAFKRYGLGAVDFIRHMPITEMLQSDQDIYLKMNFSREAEVLPMTLLGGIEPDFAWSVTL